MPLVLLVPESRLGGRVGNDWRQGLVGYSKVGSCTQVGKVQVGAGGWACALRDKISACTRKIVQNFQRGRFC